jgi:hypothetical protein
VIHRLFIVASAVSMLLYGATAVLWVRSYMSADSIRWNVPPLGGVSFLSSEGRFLLSIYGGVPGMVSGFDDESMPHVDLDSQSSRWFQTYHNWLGIGFGAGFGQSGPVIWPYWLFAVLTSLLPGLAFLNRWLPKRRPLGLCHFCGYDLRASKDRCPECGKSISVK